jgi:serine/threonine protein phosphatase 1
MEPMSTADSVGGVAGREEVSSTVRFGDGLAPLHRRFDAGSFEDIYVVGDVHGCIDELRDLLDVLDPGADDLVVFVGDLVRKGPDGEAVLDLVAGAPNMVSVRGNNEQKFLDGEEPAARLGGDLDPLASMPAAVSVGDALVVHAGVDPRRPFGDHSLDDLLETRAIPPENGYDGPFWFELHEGPPRVFFGHTVLSSPVDRDWAVGLDTGCVYGGDLTAYDCRTREFVSVPARETYKQREDDSIVDPPDP